VSSKVRQLKLNINVCISPSKSPLDIRLSAMDWLGVDPTLPPVADKISASYKTYEEQQTLARATALAEKYDAWAFDEFTLAYFPSTEGAYAYAEDLSCFFQPENVYPGHASIVNGIPVDDEWLRVYTKACFMAGKNEGWHQANAIRDQHHRDAEARFKKWFAAWQGQGATIEITDEGSWEAVKKTQGDSQRHLISSQDDSADRGVTISSSWTYPSQVNTAKKKAGKKR
jgi:hypothetical protein